MQIVLYYHPICPFSKQIITLIGELGYKYSLIKEEYWRQNKSFIELSPWRELPVILVEGTLIVAGVYPCIEYLMATKPNFYLFGQDIEALARMRQVINWFNKHFYDDVLRHILDERMIKLDLKTQYPDTNVLRNAKIALNKHLLQLSAIISSQDYLICESLSFADIVAASHLAVLDYFHDINWSMHYKIKNWYCLIKSRPTFRATLYEKIKGINPPAHYLNLDF